MQHLYPPPLELVMFLAHEHVDSRSILTPVTHYIVQGVHILTPVPTELDVGHGDAYANNDRLKVARKNERRLTYIRLA